MLPVGSRPRARETRGSSGWTSGPRQPGTPRWPAFGEKSDERWRDVITSLVQEGQEAGEFREVDPARFALYLSTLLDGLTIQIALNDPVVDSMRAFELSMQFVADQLGFKWTPGRRRVGQDDQVRGDGYQTDSDEG